MKTRVEMYLLLVSLLLTIISIIIYFILHTEQEVLLVYALQISKDNRKEQTSGITDEFVAWVGDKLNNSPRKNLVISHK